MYSQPYIILISVLLTISMLQIFIRFDKNSVTLFNVLAVLIFILFFGLRGFIGWDWTNYYPFFKSMPDISNFKIASLKYEIGYSYFSSIVKTLTKDYHIYILINTLIDITLLSIFFKRYLPNYMFTLALVIFVIMDGLILELNLLRNIKGILLFLISLKHIEKREPFKFLFWNLIGLSFHWSSIIYLPFYFFLSKKIDLRFFIAIFVVGNIIYLLQLQFISPFIQFISQFMGETVQERTDIYMGSAMYGAQYGISIGYIEKVITSILLMIYYNALTQGSKSNIMFINSFIVYFIVYFYFTEISIVVSRVGILFIYSYWILWPLIINFSSNANKYIVFLFFAIYLNLRIVKLTNNVLFEYDNVILGKYKSFKERDQIFMKYYKQLQK